MNDQNSSTTIENPGDELLWTSIYVPLFAHRLNIAYKKSHRFSELSAQLYSVTRYCILCKSSLSYQFGRIEH